MGKSVAQHRSTVSGRQRIRRAAIIMSFLLFPITLNYFSPYIIVEGAFQGIVNGSLIAFALMFLSSLFLGRAWCGWGCPGGGLQDCLTAVNERPARIGRADLIKWAIWVPWIVLIAVAVISAGGYRTIDPFHLTAGGISVSEPMLYVPYYTVLGLFVLLSIVAGRRAACHYICWMAPFMIIGRKVRNLFQWPSLRLSAEPNRCTNCGICNRGCPMSLPVSQMVHKRAMEHTECALCGACADNCPQRAIRYFFGSGS